MRKYLTFLFAVLFVNFVFADSPLTSTSIYKAYLDVPMVVKVSKSNGNLNDEIFDYLNSNSIRIDKKIAVINALKWNHNGRKNAEDYLKKLFLAHKDYNYGNFYYHGTAQELILFSYLKSLDNYFDVKKALVFSNRAAKMNPNSYTITIINLLIKAQTIPSNKWCEVYKLNDKIKTNRKLIIDFRTEASNIIFKYIDFYKSSCSN